MRFRLSAKLLLSTSVLILAMSSHALADCWFDGDITFAKDCDADFGVNGTVGESGSKLTIENETFDDPDDQTNSFSRIVLKAGDESAGAINIGVEVVGTSLVDSHNSAAVYLLTKKGDITVDISADVTLNAQQGGIFAKADSGTDNPGGMIIVTNAGTITAGTLASGSFGADGIRVRALQGAGYITNSGSVTSTLGRGLRIDAGDATSGDLGNISNSGTVDAWLDAAHVHALSGSATVYNTGVLTSRSARGAVASSQEDSAYVGNYGTITGATGGVLAWGATWAQVGNYGSLSAAEKDSDDSNDFLNFGVQVWATDTGYARFDNGDAGEVIAHDGWGAWLLSTNGDVFVQNTGTILGKTTAIHVGGDGITEQWEENPVLDDYAGAVGGKLTLINSGLITSDESNSFQNGFGLISLFGYDITQLSVTNAAGGLIASAVDDDNDYSLSTLADLSAEELDELAPLAASGALSIGAEAEEVTISNAGTLVGRVRISTPMNVFGDGPSESAAATLTNTGLWVTSGASEFSGTDGLTIENSGDIFTVGSTTVTGSIENAGSIWINSTDSTAGSFTVNGDYAGLEGGSLIFDLTRGDHPLATFDGAVSGQTSVLLANIESFDWRSYNPELLILTTDTDPEEGAESFVLDDALVGVIEYRLDYDADAMGWMLSAGVSETVVDDVAQTTASIGDGFARIGSGILNRTDDLRDGVSGDLPPSEPMGYTEVSTPMDEAMAALAPTAVDTRLWLKAGGAIGAGTGYGVSQSGLELGGDVSTTIDGRQVSAGVFAGLSNASFDFDSSSSAGAQGYAAGLYANVLAPSGTFVSGVAAVEATDIGLLVSGVEADVAALNIGGRIDAGYRANLDGLVLEPSVGVMVSHNQMGSFSLNDSVVAVDNGKSLSTEGRLRIMRRFAGEVMDITPFLVLNLGNRVADGGEVSVEGVTTSAQAGGIYGGVSLGLGIDTPDNSLNGFIRSDLSATADSYLASFRIGGSRRF